MNDFGNMGFYDSSMYQSGKNDQSVLLFIILLTTDEIIETSVLIWFGL